MPDALTWFWERLDSIRPVFFDHERVAQPVLMWEQLLGRGVICETTPSLHAGCPGCASGRLERVRWLPDVRTQVDAPWVTCPHCGPTRLAVEGLRQWTIDVAALLTYLATIAGLKNAVAEIVPKHLWHLGTGKWCSKSYQVYFARFVHGPARAAFRAALAPYPRAVVLHPTEHAARVWNGVIPNPAVALESAVTSRSDNSCFDSSIVESALEDAGLIGQQPAKERAPPPKRGTRADDIARLTRAVIEHLHTAREHAFSMVSMKGAAELYPRPPQKHLAKLLGITEYAVTRCFQDESSRELKLYWDMALDLAKIMKFSGPIGGGSEAS